MITVEQATRNVGRKVIYNPAGGTAEEGVITGASDRWVFVRYGSDMHSKATYPSELQFATSGGEVSRLGGASTSPSSGSES